MAGFYAARSRIIPPLPWSVFAPPLSDDGAGNSYALLGDGADVLYFAGLTKEQLQADDFTV